MLHFFLLKLYIEEKSFSTRILSLIWMCEIGAVITTNHSVIQTKYYTFSPKYYNRQHKAQHRAKSEMPFLSSTSTLHGHLHLRWRQSDDAALLPKYSGYCCAGTYSFTDICGSEVVVLLVISKGSRISRAQEPNWHRSRLLMLQWQSPSHHHPRHSACVNVCVGFSCNQSTTHYHTTTVRIGLNAPWIFYLERLAEPTSGLEHG